MQIVAPLGANVRGRVEEFGSSAGATSRVSLLRSLIIYGSVSTNIPLLRSEVSRSSGRQFIQIPRHVRPGVFTLTDTKEAAFSTALLHGEKAQFSRPTCSPS